MTSFTVKSGQGDYEVRFEDSVQDVAAGLAALPRALVLLDRNVARLHGNALARLTSAHPALEIDATEDAKTWEGAGRVLDWMLQQRCDKGVRLVAVGGGIIQDLAGFVAHVFHRGLKWEFAPTTLLAQADSCIGAKSGINLGEYKNQAGAFHSPSCVRVSAGFLPTLSDADIGSGWGEILKLHLTGFPRDALARLDAALADGGLRGPRLAGLVHASLLVKKEIIEEDEYEKGRRVLLNYGHTFGHALEAVTHHRVPHGLAVAWGLDLLNYVAWRRGRAGEDRFRSVHEWIARNLQFTHGGGVTARALVEAAGRDKKASAGGINLVMPDARGALFAEKTPLDGALEALVAGYIGEADVFGGGRQPMDGGRRWRDGM